MKTTSWRATPKSKGMPPDQTGEGLVYLAFDARKLHQLLTCNAVSVTDFHCLDRASKQRVWTLCLQACAQALHIRT